MQSERRDIHNSETPALCMSCEARHNGMCGVLDPKQLLLMSRHTRIETHAAGTELIGESTPITSYANVMRGVIKLTKILEDGRQQVVGLQFAPDFLGRLFGDEHRVNAEAASEVTICRVPKTALEHLVAASPALEHRLMQQALRELDDARDWMVTLGRKTAAEKVASFLYLIATHIDPAAMLRNSRSASFELPLGRADIADFLGLTIETVSRQLTKLRTDKVITVVNTRHVDIPDLERLKGRCG